MKKFIAVPLFLICAMNHLPAREKPDRSWTNPQGKTLTGTYRRCDGATVWIKSTQGEIPVALAAWSPADPLLPMTTAAQMNE